ncbi:MAG: PAS domain-containing protein [Methylococcales bacterium]|nr:PAS domain-containing protein [Methylococcales bacterium]
MSPKTASRSNFANRNGAIAVVLTYALFAAFWILLSDKLVQILFSDPNQIILISMLKGWFFVVITSLLLYGLMRRWIGGGKTPLALPGDGLRLGWPFFLALLIITALCSAVITKHLAEHKQTEFAKLQAIADLKSRQISGWLKGRLDDADFVTSSPLVTGLYHLKQISGEMPGGTQLSMQLEQLLKSQGFTAITLLSPQGQPLWGSSQAPLKLTANALSIAQLAMASHTTRLTDPYLNASGKISLDLAVPMAAVGPTPVVMLQVELSDWITPLLQSSPELLQSTQVQLFRQAGGQVLFLNGPLHKQGAAALLGVPLATKTLLAGRFLRGEVPTNDVVKGDDYLGVPSIGVIRPIAGTEWYVLVKLDQTELYTESMQDVAWISLIGLLVMISVSTVFYLLRQAQQLALVGALQKSQAERLNTLNLLHSIADSSDDAIFATDLEGRYILFNRAACRLVGKQAEEVLGHDDRSIFSDEQAGILIALGQKIMAEKKSYAQEEVLEFAGIKKTLFTTKGPLYDSLGKIIGVFGITRDISDRKQAELDLQASEMSYRSLFDNMTNAYSYCRMLYENGQPTDFVYLKVNAAFTALTGFKSPENRKVSELMPGLRESNPEIFQIKGRIALGASPERFETYIQALDSWFSVSVYSPKQEHFVAIFDVITERKRAEIILRESEQFKHAVLDSLDAHIAVVDNQGVITAVNRAWQAFAQNNGPYQDGSTGIGASYFEVCRNSVGPFSDEAQAAFDGINDVLESRTPSFSLEYPCHSPSERRWFIMTVQPMGYGQQGAVITHTNITARKLAEESLNALNNDMSATLQAIPDLLFEVDGTGRYIKVKTTQEALLAMPAPQLLERKVQDVMPPEAAQTVMDALASATQSGYDYGRTINLPTIMGDRHFELSVARKAGGAEIIPHFILISRDITDRKAAEESLRLQAKELAERNDELVIFNRAMVGREQKMIELKQEINALSVQLGQKPPYQLAFLGEGSQQDPDKS